MVTLRVVRRVPGWCRVVGCRVIHPTKPTRPGSRPHEPGFSVGWSGGLKNHPTTRLKPACDGAGCRVVFPPLRGRGVGHPTPREEPRKRGAQPPGRMAGHTISMKNYGDAGSGIATRMEAGEASVEMRPDLVASLGDPAIHSAESSAQAKSQRDGGGQRTRPAECCKLGEAPSLGVKAGQVGGPEKTNPRTPRSCGRRERSRGSRQAPWEARLPYVQYSDRECRAHPQPATRPDH